MFQKCNFFGTPSRTPLEELTALPLQTPSLMGRGLAAFLPRTPPRSRPFGPRFYTDLRVDLTHYRVGNPTNYKCRPTWNSYFFGFGERRKWTQ